MSEKRKSLGVPREVAKQQLLDDPETHKIAKALGIDLEDYIEQVLHYAMNPELEAQVEVLDDEELAEMDANVPTEGDVLRWLEGVDKGDIDISSETPGIKAKDGFSTEKSKEETLMEAAGKKLERAAPTLPPPRQTPGATGPGSALKDQLLSAQRQMNLAQDARRAQKPGGKKK